MTTNDTQIRNPEHDESEIIDSESKLGYSRPMIKELDVNQLASGLVSGGAEGVSYYDS